MKVFIHYMLSNSLNLIDPLYHIHIYILLEAILLINILLGQIQIFSYQVGEQDQTRQHCCLQKLVCAPTGSIDARIFEWHFV